VSAASMFPIVAWSRIENAEADARLSAWRHYLGPCNRPFGKISFGLLYDGEIVSVAVAATIVKASCFGYKRTEVCELARCVSHPKHADMTRVMVRLFRKTVGQEWAQEYWPIRSILSYSRKDRHLGNIYRFDGWRRVTDTRASRVGTGSHHSTPGKEIPAKTLWAWDIPQTATSESAA
jgi:hypothetical protein